MNVFDIIGPVMIGPSSSHTAGACRLGLVARKVLAERPVAADIGLCGSFAQTYRGHGTDKAIVAGIMGMAPDDGRLRDSLGLARQAGLCFQIHEAKLGHAHPNTAIIALTGEGGAACQVVGASVGGGNILISQVNGVETMFSGACDTLIIPHRDVPGLIASVTAAMAALGVNINNFRLSRQEKGYKSVMTIEVDGTVTDELVARLRGLPDVFSVVCLRVK